MRTHAHATSGQLIRQHFYSQYHYWDPVYGEIPPERVYTLDMRLVESDAPTEIYVPDLQYPDGFYVWVSDGHAYFDSEEQMLYWYPTNKTAGTQHHLRIEARFDDREALGWSYYMEGASVIRGVGDSTFSGGEVLQ